MLVYFDESYNDRYLLYGALFNPHPSYLHQGILDIKHKHNLIKNGVYEEIKYNSTLNEPSLKAAKDVVDLFSKSTSWFRAVVIDLDGFDYNFFGQPNESLKMKKARAYKKFAEMLIDKNAKNIKNAVLLCDELNRCRGDEFIEKLKEKYQHGTVKIFREIAEIDSKLEQYQVNQVNDVLLGSILNDLAKPANIYKNRLKDHVVRNTQFDSLCAEHWESHTKKKLDEISPKFQIWYWQKNTKA